MKAKLLLLLAITILLASCKKENVSPEVKPPVIVKKPDTIPVLKADTIPDTAFFKLQVKSTTNTVFSDQDIVRFLHKAKANYSRMEDAAKMPSNGDLSMAVLSADGIGLVIDATPYKSGMQIGIDLQAKADNDCVISMASSYKMPASIHIWLKDKLKADSVDLAKGNYSFSLKKADTTSYGANRFKLVIR